jgi:hypothetical protein
MANVKLIQASVILTVHLKILSSADLRHGINAYAFICRETKAEFMDVNFDKVQRAFRVSIKNKQNLL